MCKLFEINGQKDLSKSSKRFVKELAQRMEAILHINSSNQGFSYYTLISVVKPGFQLLNQGFSQISAVKPEFQTEIWD